jgi:hypothetical protein
MVAVCPATIKVPRRDAGKMFPATEKVTAPLPEPLAPEVMFSQPELLEAVQPQAGALAATPIVLLTLPDAGNTGLSLVMLKLHDTPAWVTWNGWPPMSIEPERGVVLELGATE